MVGRLIGWVLMLIGIVLLVRDVANWADTHIWAPVALGQLWYNLDRGSLGLVQAVVQRDIAPSLWDPVITTLLFCWAFAVFIVLGLFVHHLFRERSSTSF